LLTADAAIVPADDLASSMSTLARISWIRSGANRSRTGATIPEAASSS
jgi:hypothetical protein